MDETPHFNWSFLGNPGLLSYLQRVIVKRKYAHAYLFVGPEQGGKRTLVRTFIQSILCAEFHQRSGLAVREIPCQKCIHCQQSLKGVHPDVIFLTREQAEKTGQEKKNISIGQVRVLQSQLSSTTFLNIYKFAVIEEAEALTPEAVNGLLKTLEEPKKDVIICLIAEQREALFKTLVSRCQVFPVRRVSTKTLSAWLHGRGISREEAITFAQLASGLPGRAIQLSTDRAFYKEHQATVQDFVALCETNLFERLKKADDIVRQGGKDHVAGADFVCTLFKRWTEVLTDVLLLKHLNGGDGGRIQNAWFTRELVALSKRFTDEKLLSLLEYLEGAQVKLRSNINMHLLLDHFFIYL